jgi:hypothetical protein
MWASQNPFRTKSQAVIKTPAFKLGLSVISLRCSNE